MQEQTLQRATLLMEQNRYQEARQLIEQVLQDDPNHLQGLYYLCAISLQEGNKEESRKIAKQLLHLEPTSIIALRMSILVSLTDEHYEAAEEKCNLLTSLEPEYAEGWSLLGRVKLGQRNYDRSLEAIDRALSIDPEDEEALNLKILVGGFLNKKDTAQAIQDSLQLNPENPSTIANHGYQLVREGKIKEALERLSYALSLDPTNALARMGMIQALKSRFFLYRLFFKYMEFTSKLTGGGSWTFIIGIYIGFRVLNSIADNNPMLQPILTPIIYIILGLFLLTWVINPLMNIYLLTNKYGRLLLDKDDKKMAILCGVSLFAGITSFLAYYILINSELLFVSGLLFIVFLIPLGSFLSPTRTNNRKITLGLTVVIVVAGILMMLINDYRLLYLSAGGIFIYQWVINGILIKEESRVMD